MITQAGLSRQQPDGTRTAYSVWWEWRQRLLLADGKRRKVARPKAKKPGHVTCLTDSLHVFDHPVVHSLQEGEPVSDRALRRALAAFKEGYSLG